MSPMYAMSASTEASVPRASGDEPKGLALPGVLSTCSPRERG